MNRRYAPIVGITANVRTSDVNPNVRQHSVSESYGQVIADIANAMPMFLPPLGESMCIDTLLNTLDGLVLTGGAANIEPHHYGQTPAPGEDPRDPGRDRLVLPLIRRAVALGLPVLGVCRGIQEINVALGGTLHQRLHNVEGRGDHRRNREIAWDDSMAPRHCLRLTPGGVLAKIAGGQSAEVNSLHGQGLDRVADDLRVEALCEDGTIEAVSLKREDQFLLGVQWHPEYRTTDHAFYTAIFAAFGQAVGRYAEDRLETHTLAEEAIA
jgi:putative glutamine amidotransferase